MLAKKPQWLRKKVSFQAKKETDELLKDIGIATICQEASCPNISECFSKKQATFLILGTICTRACTFCDVSRGKPKPVDEAEIQRVVEAVKRMGLENVVITSVTRDDLSDGGAEHFVKCVKALKDMKPDIKIELLIPDLNEDKDAIFKVSNCGADIVGHNIETIPRRYDVRGGSNYQKSLRVLKLIKETNPFIKTKSAIMLGLGEKEDEVVEVFKDLRKVGCDFLSLGQYLSPSKKHTPVLEYVHPDKFKRYKELALNLGFDFVMSSPYTRSSYMAHEYLKN
jgi:lipoic acid synthetase